MTVIVIDAMQMKIWKVLNISGTKNHSLIIVLNAQLIFKVGIHISKIGKTQISKSDFFHLLIIDEVN